jgi:hypothetical protein
MINSTMMRKILWVGVAFNAIAALMLAFPNSLGALVGLPPVGSIFYPWLLAFFVALFGATYAWLAVQPTLHRPLVMLAAIGKTGVFVVALACLLRGDIAFRAFSVAIGDLVFAGIFFLWLRSTSVSASNA